MVLFFEKKVRGKKEITISDKAGLELSRYRHPDREEGEVKDGEKISGNPSMKKGSHFSIFPIRSFFPRRIQENPPKKILVIFYFFVH
jgi:hypothetical protein